MSSIQGGVIKASPSIKRQYVVWPSMTGSSLSVFNSPKCKNIEIMTPIMEGDLAMPCPGYTVSQSVSHLEMIKISMKPNKHNSKITYGMNS